jgi:hypothetical protein
MEFSAPKLIFNDNVNELEEKDFNNIIITLREKVKDMGVQVWTDELEKADIISFHPSKNIVLNNNYPASYVIKELNKADISKRFDNNKTNYRNNGEVLQIYTNSHSSVIYDKINDLKKPTKRATDKDQTKKQLSLFEYIREEKPRLEIIRTEIRLSKKKKMNEILGKLGYSKNPTFKDIFKKDLCQKIVILYWNQFFEDNLFLFTGKTPQDILELILREYPKTKITSAIRTVGFYILCKDDEGMRGFRKIIDSHKPSTNWQTAKRDIKSLQDKLFSNSPLEFIDDIKQNLKEFKPLRLNINDKQEVDK